MRIEIKNDKEVKASQDGTNKIQLFYNEEYQQGDKICIYPDEVPTYLHIKIDDAIEETMIYLKDGIFEYYIPFEQQRKSYSYKAFYNKKHLIKVTKPSLNQIQSYQNLALNTVDQENQNHVFPHVSSSLDDKLQPVFQAKNIIDGLTFNNDHGRWPYTSWSYMQDSSASLTIDFGRKVNVEEIHIYLRADFPHDSYFKKISLEFSNGVRKQLDLISTNQAQVFKIKQKDVERICFYGFIKNEDESNFAAISQIEVYGYNQ